MKICKEIFGKDELLKYLKHNTWAGASDKIWNMSEEELEKLMDYLLSMEEDTTLTETELNDFIWFEWDEIKEEL